MSALWHASIISASPDSLILRVQAVHPDAGEIPDTRIGTFRLLCDAGEFNGMSGGAAIEYAMAHRAIRSVEVDSRQNFPFDEQRALTQIAEPLWAEGLAPGQAGWQDGMAKGWSKFWKDGDRAPSAILKIRLGDTSTFPQFHPEMEWDSAAYQ
ncbi:hypothetical protein ACIBL5_36415 [Streptomyces sp. NPDC050516]|uniref:hypothetical protein n=1 Tax=Streptomyces sp. NPDC050516 TaxID=3365621 RepID=UPI0037ACED98